MVSGCRCILISTMKSLTETQQNRENCNLHFQLVLFSLIISKHEIENPLVLAYFISFQKFNEHDSDVSINIFIQNTLPAFFVFNFCFFTFIHNCCEDTRFRLL